MSLTSDLTCRQFIRLERRLSHTITLAWAEQQQAVREAASAPTKAKYHPLPHQFHQSLKRGEKPLAERLLEAAAAQGLQPGDVCHVSELARSIGGKPECACVAVSHLRHAGKWPYKSPREKSPEGG